VDLCLRQKRRLSQGTMLVILRGNCLKYFGSRSVSKSCLRFSHSSSDNIRNVGIMAHIDAGKTTTTERMLFYSGYSAKVGEVHTGNTVMDYLDQERDRGITITSAAITFPWRKHQINLIDTPGHVDFTMEVERSMAVLDGGVVVLDGSAGVEAQTVTVWRQAEKYGVPRIAYINKLDKPAASVAKTVKSIEKRLAVKPLVTQICLGGEGKSFYGLVDLVSMQAFKWRLKDENWGKSFSSVSSEEMKTSMFNSWEVAMKAREELIEEVTDFDSVLADYVIETESFDNVSESDLKAALRRVSLSPSSGALVTLLGSSYANVGVQPLMNAIVDYCPSPNDRGNKNIKKFGNNFSGLVFKIIHHPMKGVLCFVRVYTGRLTSKDSVYNVNHQKTEKIGKLYLAFADDFIEAGEVDAGNIVVIAGLKLAQTGDTLVISKSVVTAIEAQAENDNLSTAALVGPSVPDPVVFCSVEPPSLAEQKQFDLALACLGREDPSLRITNDAETGQTVLGGMGELHLEIIKDRMLSTYKVEVDLGKLQIAYREMPDTTAREKVTFTRNLGDKQHTVTLEVEIEPLEGGGKPKVVFSKDREAQDSFANLKPKQLRKITAGLMSGLESGPLLSFPVLDCVVVVHRAEVGRGTQDTMVVAGSATIVREVLGKSGVRLAEPIMMLEVSTEQEMVGRVVQDMVSRRGNVLSTTDGQGEGMVVCGHVPLAELKGYSREVRTKTSGRANIAMELGHYQIMSPFHQDKAIEDVTGFASR